MNKRDEISIMPYHVEWKHVPDNWPFDKEGNPFTTTIQLDNLRKWTAMILSD